MSDSATDVIADPSAQLYSFEQTIQPEQGQSLNNSANFNGVAANFEVRAPQPTSPDVAPAKVVQDIVQEAATDKVRSINTGRSLVDGVNGASDMAMVAQGGGSWLTDTLDAGAKLTASMREGPQLPVANKNEIPVVENDAVSNHVERNSVLDTSLTERDTAYTDLARDNFSPTPGFG